MNRRGGRGSPSSLIEETLEAALDPVDALSISSHTEGYAGVTMLLRIDSEKRDHLWYVEARGVPGTGSLCPTRDEAVAETLRKVADKVAHHELTLNMDVLIADAPPAGQPAFTAADFLAVWRTLPHGDTGLADDVEAAARNQGNLADERSPWDS